MKEVDEALARVYAQHGPGGALRKVPPAPHLPAARVASPDEHDRGEGPNAIASAPSARDEHRPVVADPPTAAVFEPTVELQWPSVVLLLEQQWGDRFERLADFLIESSDEQDARVVLFTSCHRAEGRTSLVLALARALSRRPRRTVLVDADLAGPMMARLLGLRPEIGYEDVIESGRGPAEALIDCPDDHLTILPLRSAVANPRELLSGPGWRRAVGRLRREFDFVLLDGGPLFNGLGASAPPPCVDAAVLVRRRELTGERAMLRAREALESAGVALLGTAETFA